MENRKGTLLPGHRPDHRPPFTVFHFVLSILFSSLLIIGGCASPGDPYARNSLVPQPVTDLAAEQSGNDVVLTFTMPREAADRRSLDQPPAIEIYRDFEKPSGAGETPATVRINPTLLVTIPAAMEDRYTEQSHIRYIDSLHADDFAKHPDGVAVYTVRTLYSGRKPSADSDVARVLIHPVPDPIDDVKAEVTRSAVMLTWSAPQTSLAGAAPPIAGYRIYRGIAEPGTSTSGAAAGDLKLKSPLAMIGETETAAYQDDHIEFDESYVYSIRSVTQYPGGTLESAGSKVTVVTPRDTFPPAVPEGLVVVLVPAQGGTPARLELSWDISEETDIAGYNIYRSDRIDVQGGRVNTELLLTPAFRDMNVLPGHRYFYTVTAVDRSGNESPSSAPVSGDVPAEGKPTP